MSGQPVPPPAYENAGQHGGAPPAAAAAGQPAAGQQAQGGSFFSKLKAGAAFAATAVAAAAAQGVQSAKQGIADLKAPPSKVRCSGCPLEVDVPATIWDWTCAAGHPNARDAAACATCQGAKPQRADPTVTCPTCNAVTVVPSSNASKALKDAGHNTKKFAVGVVAATKATVNNMTSAPTTFHCSHCNTLLAVPTGPWACQTCTTENVEDAKNCKQCGQKKSDQKAICGVCRQSTVIPSTVFVDHIKSGVKEIGASTKKLYYDGTGKPYVTCGRCATHVSVPAPAAPAGAGAPPEGQPNVTTQEVMCPNCKNRIE